MKKKIIFILSLCLTTVLSVAQNTPYGCIVPNTLTGGSIFSGTTCTPNDASYVAKICTTANLTFTIPAATGSSVRTLDILNDSVSGSVPFNLFPGGIIAPNERISLRWNGTKWTVLGRFKFVPAFTMRGDITIGGSYYIKSEQASDNYLHLAGSQVTLNAGNSDVTVSSDQDVYMSGYSASILTGSEKDTFLCRTTAGEEDINGKTGVSHLVWNLSNNKKTQVFQDTLSIDISAIDTLTNEKKRINVHRDHIKITGDSDVELFNISESEISCENSELINIAAESGTDRDELYLNSGSAALYHTRSSTSSAIEANNNKALMVWETGSKYAGVIADSGGVSISTLLSGAYKAYLRTANLNTNQFYQFPDISGEITTNNSTVSLINKTISGSSNTLTNIGNSSLTNSSISIAGNSTSLGGSVTQDQITGLSGTGVVTRTGSNALTTISTTGTGNAVLATSPSLVTPNIGSAVATKVNDITITDPGTGATITLGDGSTLQLSGSFLLNLIVSATTNATMPGGSYTVSKSADVQIFESSGTWTKPTGAKSVYVYVLGPGSGGGSGAKHPSGTLSTGGGGGSAGSGASFTFDASQLTSTVAVTVGTGGAGGASVTTNSTNGNSGSVGSSATSFGPYLDGRRGSTGGGGGSNSGAGSGGVANGSMYTASAGAASSATGGAGSAPAAIATFAASGGGSGGGIVSGTPAASSGGAGGQQLIQSVINGGSAGTANNNGGNGNVSNGIYAGTGGGGGGSSITTNAGSGGNGATYGAGGGGGGAALNDTGNSGAGGNGANGICVVITYF